MNVLLREQERDYTLGDIGPPGCIGHVLVLVGRCENARCLGRKRQAIGSFLGVLTCGRGSESAPADSADWDICLAPVLFGGA